MWLRQEGGEKLSLSLGVVVSLASTAVQALTVPSEDHETRRGPRIAFENPTNDFGRVPAGKVVKCEFRFSNPGDETLRIEKVYADCGCTSVGPGTRTVPPGKKATLPILFATAEHDGLVYKRVSVFSNARGQSNVCLILTGHVWQPVEVVPSFVTLGPLGNRHAQAGATVKIINRLAQSVTLANPTSSSKSFHAELATVERGKQYELKVETTSLLTNGVNAATILVKTSAEEKPVLHIPVYIAVQPILVIPERIFLFRNASGAPAKLAVLIINRDNRELNLKQPSVNINGVELSLHELVRGKRFRIDLTVPRGLQVPKSSPIWVRVKTDHPDVPTLSIPVLEPPNQAKTL